MQTLNLKKTYNLSNVCKTNHQSCSKGWFILDFFLLYFKKCINTNDDIFTVCSDQMRCFFHNKYVFNWGIAKLNFETKQMRCHQEPSMKYKIRLDVYSFYSTTTPLLIPCSKILPYTCSHCMIQLCFRLCLQ